MPRLPLHVIHKYQLLYPFFTSNKKVPEDCVLLLWNCKKGIFTFFHFPGKAIACKVMI